MNVIAIIVLCLSSAALLIRGVLEVSAWRWRRRTLRRLDEIARRQ